MSQLYGLRINSPRPADDSRFDCRDVTDHLQVLLRKSGYHLHTTAEKEIVRMIKEKTCYIALSPSKEERESQSGGSGRSEEFRLPDGNIIRVS